MSERITHSLGFHYPDLSDFEFRLVVRLPPFSFKRAKQIIMLGKRPSLGLTSEAKAWMREAAGQLRAQWAPVFRSPIPKDVQLNAAIRSFLPTRQLPDASNLYEGPQDAMKQCGRWCKPKCDRHAGVLVDDVSIRTHDGSDRLYDPAAPRVEIVLSPYRGVIEQPGLPGLAAELDAAPAEMEF